jgi:hypothetical protein
MTEQEKLKLLFAQSLVLNGLIDTSLQLPYFSRWEQNIKEPVLKEILRLFDKNGIPKQPHHMACINMLYNLLVLPWELLGKSAISTDTKAWNEVNSLLANVEILAGNKPRVERLRNALAHGRVDITDPFIFEDWKPQKDKSDKSKDYIKFKLNPQDGHKLVITIINTVVIPFLKS